MSDVSNYHTPTNVYVESIAEEVSGRVSDPKTNVTVKIWILEINKILYRNISLL